MVFSSQAVVLTKLELPQLVQAIIRVPRSAVVADIA